MVVRHLSPLLSYSHFLLYFTLPDFAPLSRTTLGKGWWSALKSNEGGCGKTDGNHQKTGAGAAVAATVLANVDNALELYIES